MPRGAWAPPPLEPHPFPGAPCAVQVIGEVKHPPSGPHVIARVVRDVDGMDVQLYERAMHMRRAFLQKYRP